MLSTVEAHEILGVSSDAGINEVEKRYSILLKKHRMVGAQGEISSAEQEEFRMATEAYNFLMGYEEPVVGEPKKPNPLLAKMGVDEQKTRNFLYYYKYHMLIGLVVLLVIVFTVKGCIERVDPDFTTVFMGEITYNDTDKLYTEIKEAVPEIKEPGFDGIYITASGNGEQDYAMVMKEAAVMAAGGTDLYIVDKANFKKFVRQGAFLSLDDVAAKLGVDLTKNKDYVIKKDNESEAHLYGIDLSGSKELAKAGINGNEMIATIPVSAKRQDVSSKLIEYLLK